MFEESFKSQLATMDIHGSLSDELWNEIQKEYSKKSRHYHNIAHLDNLIKELFAIKEQITDWQTVIFSVAYHDIIYNTLKTDNEQRSANHARKRLTQLSMPEFKIEKCVNQILATRGHELSKDNDTNFFTDADLSTLGKDHQQYIHYSSLIRKEYKYYPDLVYNPGRKKVLQNFLSMPTIFKTIYFREKYEKQAKENLAFELTILG